MEMAACSSEVKIIECGHITALLRGNTKKEVLTSTILCTCLLMVRGSGLGATPRAQSTTTEGLEGVGG